MVETHIVIAVILAIIAIAGIAFIVYYKMSSSDDTDDTSSDDTEDNDDDNEDNDDDDDSDDDDDDDDDDSKTGTGTGTGNANTWDNLGAFQLTPLSGGVIQVIKPDTKNTCESKCAANTNCVAYSKSTDVDNLSCYLLKNVDGASKHGSMISKLKRSRNTGSVVYGRAPADSVTPVHSSPHYYSNTENSVHSAFKDAKTYAVNQKITNYSMVVLKYGFYNDKHAYQYKFYKDAVAKNDLVDAVETVTFYV